MTAQLRIQLNDDPHDVPPQLQRLPVGVSCSSCSTEVWPHNTASAEVHRNCLDIQTTLRVPTEPRVASARRGLQAREPSAACATPGPRSPSVPVETRRGRSVVCREGCSSARRIAPSIQSIFARVATALRSEPGERHPQGAYVWIGARRYAPADTARDRFSVSVVSVSEGRASCWTEYRSESRARPKSTAEIAWSHALLRKCRIFRALRDGLGQTKQPRHWQRLSTLIPAQPSVGSQARSSRLTGSSSSRWIFSSADIAKQNSVQPFPVNRRRETADRKGLQVQRSGSKGLASSATRQKCDSREVRSAQGPALQFSSGDSLGLLQPKSTTWGGRIATPAPSGRAAYDYAIGLAVTRFNFASLATKDGAEPSIGTSSDAGAVPAASTKGIFITKIPLAGAKQDRRRSDDRSCTRRDLPRSVKHNCERQSVRCSERAPRGVTAKRSPGVLGNRNPHSILRSAA